MRDSQGTTTRQWTARRDTDAQRASPIGEGNQDRTDGGPTGALSSLLNAQSLGDFLDEVRSLEDAPRHHKVAAHDVKLDQKGRLTTESALLPEPHAVSAEAMANLARLAQIPLHYLTDCEPELQSLSLNQRLRQKMSESDSLLLVLRQNTVERVLNDTLLTAPRLPILDTIVNSIPSDVTCEELRVVKYAWNGHFDVSVIALTLTCEPRENDVVAFGVNISEGKAGAVQVQGAAYRCWCSNGAINRICHGREHRIRRPTNRAGGQREFLAKILLFAREAWAQWPGHAEGVAQLDRVPLEDDYRVALRSRLRQAPFFLSLGVIDRILVQLAAETRQYCGMITLYDLWNAMTALASHAADLSRTYRTRLRLGAGEFTRQHPSICSMCRQLRLPG